MRRHAFAMLAVVPALAFGLSACGSDGGGKGSADKKAAQKVSDEEKMRKFAQCMRDNGVQMEDPEPGNGGGVRMRSKEKAGAGGKGASAGDDKMKTAMNKCRSLMPNGGKPPKLSAEDQAKQREFAKCMRQQGIDMPDPGDDGSITMRQRRGGKQFTEKEMEKAHKTCEKYLPKRPTEKP